MQGAVQSAAMENTEKQIAQNIVKASGCSPARLGLRFDKVALRLLATLRAAAEQVLPGDQALVITVTAPVKHPAKTAQVVEAQIKALLETGKQYHELTVFENKVRLRLVPVSSAQTHRLIGLVHKPDTDPGLLLDLAAEWLLTV